MSDFVERVTQQCTVILLGDWGVCDSTRGATSGDVVLGHVYREGGTVEGPTELDVSGVGLHLASYLGFFFFGNAVDSGLVGFASGCN